ncbi:probable F-box protein At2g36090 [Setaria italica]|nr:probable F-box protein At2g36090 [Setaria italica]
MGGLGAMDAAGAATPAAVEDLPADVLALVLRRLDGASLAAVGCACSALRDLAADPGTWRGLCLAMWPSLRDVPCFSRASAGGGHYYRALFADAFPFPDTTPSIPPPAVPGSAGSRPRSPLPARLVSAVDLHHGGACIMSRVVETDAASGWFLGAPFRVDALVQEGFTAPLSPATTIAPGDLALSWILIDPATGRALNASSRRPVSVDRKWLTGDTVARFAIVLPGADAGGSDVALEAAVTCDERRGHVREVSLCAEGGDGGGVSGRDALAAVAAAMAGARRGGRGAEGAARQRYEEFVRGERARKERKARREGIVDLCCSGVGAAAFLGFLVMLTLR